MKKTRCNFSRAKVRIKIRTFPLSPPKFFRPTPFFCDWHTPPKDFYGMLPQRDIYSYGPKFNIELQFFQVIGQKSNT